MNDLPKLLDNEYPFTVTFRVDEKTKKALEALRYYQRVNVGKWIRELVSGELVRRGIDNVRRDEN